MSESEKTIFERELLKVLYKQVGASPATVDSVLAEYLHDCYEAFQKILRERLRTARKELSDAKPNAGLGEARGP